MNRTALLALIAVSTLTPALLAQSAGSAQQPATPTAPASPAPAKPEPIRATAQWNLAAKDRLAIQGYDPVAYFPEAGGTAKEGLASITSDHKGAVYRFASAENKARFDANPDKFEPAYGGWCAWAMLDGEKVEVDPKSFIVKGGRLFLFYNGFFADTKAKWSKGDHNAEATKADAKWLGVSGESPRTPKSTALKDKLDAKGTELASKMPPAMNETFDKGIKDIAASGVLATALKVGDKAPDFELADASGKMVSLKSMLAEGPVVLTWYRGAWCPFCDVQLRAYQDAMPEIKAAGARMVALSPQTVEATMGLTKKASLTMDALSDTDNKVAKAYGIAYKVSEPVATILENGVQLSKVNGTSSAELPLAATYIVDTSGSIAYAFVDADYHKRAEPAEIVNALNTLKAGKK
jgi:peroxiredoxin/YHS domain-containing protein